MEKINLFVSVPYKKSSAKFKSTTIGNWNDKKSWEVLNSSEQWVENNIYLPEYGNTSFIINNTTISLDKLESVSDLWIDMAQDITRLNLNNNTLKVYGKLLWYAGNPLSPSSAVSAGTTDPSIKTIIDGGENGKIELVGKSREVFDLPGGFTTATNRLSGWTIDFNPDLGATFNANATQRFGDVIYSNGTIIHNPANRFFVDKGESAQDGIVLIKSSAEVYGLTRYYSRNNIAFKSFTVEEGGIYHLQNASQNQIGALEFNLNGKIIINNSNSFIQQYGDGINADSYSIVELRKSSTTIIKLENDTTINKELELSLENSQSLSLSGFNLYYGATADLKYSENDRTIGNEIPENGVENRIPNNLIVDGIQLTVNKPINIRGNISLINGGTIVYGASGSITEQFTPTENLFRSSQSGDWNEISTWSVYDGNEWIESVYSIPGEGNNVGLQANTTVELTSNANVKDIYFNTNVDDIRFNSYDNLLNVHGKMAIYNGDFGATTTGTTTGSGVAGWIRTGENGAINFVGDTDRDIIEIGEMSGDGNNKGWKLHVSFTNDAIATIAQVTRCWDVDIISGKCRILTGNVRPSGPWNGNSIDGALYVRSGSTFILDGQVFKSGSNPIENFILEDNAILDIAGTGDYIDAETVTFLGDLIISFDGSINFPYTVRTNSQIFDNFPTIDIIGNGLKTLVNDITVQEKFSISNSGSIIQRNTYNIEYGATCDLQYNVSFTVTDEMTAGATGSLTPYNLIIPVGETLDLNGGTYNIRGTLQGINGATAGSVINGTLNELSS